MFVSLATISLMATGFTAAATADVIDDQSGSTAVTEPATTPEDLAVSGDDSVAQSEDPQSGPADEAQSTDPAAEAPAQSDAPAARGGIGLFAAGDNNPDVVISDITLDRVPAGSGQLKIGDKAHITAKWDATNADPQPGETFYATLPAEFDFLQGAIGFPLNGPDDDGNILTWANCDLDTNTHTVTCTFTNAVADHSNVKGTVEFDVEAVAATDARKVQIDANGTTVPVDLPGGGGIVNPVQLKLEKLGSFLPDYKGIRWTLKVPGKIIADSGLDQVYLYDTMDTTNLKLCDPPNVTVSAYKNGSVVNDAPVPTATLNPNDHTDGATFSITLDKNAAGWDPTVEYRVSYDSCSLDGEVLPKGAYRNDFNIDIDGVAGAGIGVNQGWAEGDMAKGAAWVDGARQEKALWTVRIPDEVLRSKTSFDFSDTLSGSHTLCGTGGADTLSGLKIYRAYGPNASSETDVTSSFTHTPYTVGPDNKSFSTTFSVVPGSLVDQNRVSQNTNWIYRIKYTTCTDTNGLPEAGTTLSNEAHADNLKATANLNVSRKADKAGALNPQKVDIDGVKQNPGSTINWTITIPGEKLVDLNSDLTLEDVFQGPHSVCPAGPDGGSLADRMKLKVIARDQLAGSATSTGDALADVTLDSSVDMLPAVQGNGVQFTIPVPNLPLPNPPSVGGNATGFSRDYQYIITYTTCTDSGVLDEEGTEYSNAVKGFQTEYTGKIVQNQNSGGTGEGTINGNFAVNKVLSGPAANRVPAGTMFTVHVKEIAPANSTITAREYDLKVPANGDPVRGLRARGNGWTVELTEPTSTMPQINGVNFVPQFTKNDADPFASNVSISPDGKTATLSLTARGLVSLSLSNTANFNVGDVSIEKALSGGATGAVDPNKTYAVTAKFQVPEGAAAIADRNLTLKAGEPQSLTGLPVGTVVTFSEAQPVDGALLWGTPQFSQNPVTVTGGATPVDVTLTNSVEFALGGVSVIKAVTGEAVSAVDPDKEYTVNATFVPPTGAPAIDPQVLTLTAGEPVNLTGLPVGTQVTFDEVKPANDGEIIWGEPSYSAKTVTVGDAQTPVSVTITNTASYALGGVSIQKLVTGRAASGVPADQTFPVTAKFVVPEGADPIADRTLNLKAGELVNLTDLPVGTVVTFSEVKPTDGAIIWSEPVFSANPVTVESTEGAPVAVTLTNNAEWADGTFGISKTVTGVPAGTPGIPAEVKVLASWDGSEGVVSQEISVPTNGTFTPLGLNLPYGTEVTLSEEALADAAGFSWDAPVWGGQGVTANEDGTATITIGAATTVSVDLTNHATAKLGELKVIKTVTGAGASKVSKDTVFPVTATWTDLAGEKHSVDLKLTAGNPVVLKDIQVGAEVKLVEGDAKAQSGAKWTGVKWSTTSTNATVTADGKTATVVVSGEQGASADLNVENTYAEQLAKTGLDGSMALLMSVFALVIVGGGAYLVWRSRKA